MEFILSVFKFFTFSSGFVSTRDDPDLEWVRARRREYDRMRSEVENPLLTQLGVERDQFLITQNPNNCPLFDKHVDWTKAQWETYRRLNPAPPRSLR